MPCAGGRRLRFDTGSLQIRNDLVRIAGCHRVRQLRDAVEWPAVEVRRPGADAEEARLTLGRVPEKLRRRRALELRLEEDDGRVALRAVAHPAFGIERQAAAAGFAVITV